jgi:DNA-binding response OmpR family regulator
MKKPLILLIEDHDDLREATLNFLIQEGFEVIGLSCAEDLDDTPTTRTPDLYIIDLNLPGEDGLSLSRRIRRSQPLSGILIATAKGELGNRIEGYQSGADIYLSKPVDPRELVAALHSLAKRQESSKRLTNTFVLDTSLLKLSGPDGFSKVSESESRLLAALATAKDNTLERWQVAQQLNPGNSAISADNLQNRLSQLRKKIAICGVEGDAIRSVRSRGYRLCIDLEIL